MKTFLFTIRLTGIGETLEEAWRDAIEATNLEEDPVPDIEDCLLLEDTIEEDE